MNGESKVSGDICQLIYPNIKPVNVAREIKVGIVKSSVLPRKLKKAIYFRTDYRFDRIVIDSIAMKYGASAEGYPGEDDDDERFLLGSTVCDNSALETPQCQYLKKAWEVLRKNRVSRKKIFAIYLLGTDDGEENDQRFVVLAKEKVYFRWETRKLEAVDYQDIFFDEDGLRCKELIPGLPGEGDGYLVKYSFDSRFVAFAKEILLLKAMYLDGIEETHPAGGLPDDKKNTYFDFLVEAAAGARKLNAMRLLRLEYLAREFYIDVEAIENGLKRVLPGKKYDTKLANRFHAIYRDVTSEEILYVFFQELLDFITDDSGAEENEKLYSLIKKIAGDSFVRSYCGYLKANREADRLLRFAFERVDCPELNLKASYRLQRYDNALRLNTLKTGVEIYV